MKKIIQLLCYASLCLTVLVWTSCDNEKGCTDPSSLTFDPVIKESDERACDYPDLSLNFNFKVANEALEFGKKVSVNGTVVQFEEIAFYLSNVGLRKQNGDTIKLKESYSLIQPNEPLSKVGQFEVAIFRSIQFDLGVDATTNNEKMPIDWEDGHPLANSNMYYGAADKGYIFAKIIGKVDTDGDGIPSTDMVYELGSSALLQEVGKNINLNVKEKENLINLNINLARVFEGIDISIDHATSTYDSPIISPNDPFDVAKKMMVNFVDAITVD